MAECIYFESVFQSGSSQKQRVVTTPSGNEWLIEEEWSVGVCNMIQEIVIRKRDYFESYYYVDLEIYPASNECDSKICKSKRTCSNNIRFIICGNEYSRFGTFVGGVDCTADDHSSGQLYRYKVILTPIFQFMNEKCLKPFGKRTKVDLLKGLKKLSKDISSLRDDQNTDVVICCGEEQVKAHKNILSVRSTVFCHLFRNITEDNRKVEDCFKTVRVEIGSNDDPTIKAMPSSDNFLKITLENIDPSIFDELIDFIYTGLSKTFDIQNSKGLFVAAHNYGIHDLKKKCVLFLKSKICKETREELYNFASTYTCKELQNYVLDQVKNEILGKKGKKGNKRMNEKQKSKGRIDEDLKSKERMGVSEIEGEEKMDEEEKKKWMAIMEDHPEYLEDILKEEKKDDVYGMLRADFYEIDICDGGNEEVERADCTNNRATIVPSD